MLLLLGAACAFKFRPIVIWHGLGDSGKHVEESVVPLLQKLLPDVQVFAVAVGDTSAQDVRAGYFGNTNTQVL